MNWCQLGQLVPSAQLAQDVLFMPIGPIGSTGPIGAVGRDELMPFGQLVPRAQLVRYVPMN